jgi:hypothetical protein
MLLANQDALINMKSIEKTDNPMKLKLPIVTVCRKEMWEREQQEYNSDKLAEMGVPVIDAVDYEHEKDRLVPYVIDLNRVDAFYMSYVHFNEIECEGVRVREIDGYQPPVFVIKFTDFEMIYQNFLLGQYVEQESNIIDYKTLIPSEV